MTELAYPSGLPSGQGSVRLRELRDCLRPLWLRPGLEFGWSLHNILQGTWPLGVALVIGVVAMHAWRRAGRPPLPEIPAGDVLLPMEYLACSLRDGAAALAERLRRMHDQLQRLAADVRRRGWGWIDDSADLEAWLNRWPVALTLLILVGAFLAWLSA